MATFISHWWVIFVHEVLPAAWEGLRHPLCYGLIAWALASWYQNRSKMKDFRFSTFKDAVRLHVQLADQSTVFLRQHAVRKAPESALTERGKEDRASSGLVDATNAFDQTFSEAGALGYVIGTLFQEKTQQHWLRLNHHYTSARFGKAPAEMYSEVARAIEAGNSFIEGAAREVPLRYRPAKVEVPDGRDTTARVKEILSKIDPQEGAS